MRFLRMSRTQRSSSSTGSSSSVSSLSSIRQDLFNIENGLTGGGGGGGREGESRRSRRRSGTTSGRAMFSSITTMLSSLRSRIEQHATTNERDAENLLERVRTAQMAHANRVPLDIYRSSQRQLESATSSSAPSSTSRRTMLLQQQSSNSNNDTNKLRRSSSLVASRRRLHDVETEDLHASTKNLHASSSGGVSLMLSPVDEGHDSVEMVWTPAEDCSLSFPEMPVIIVDHHPDEPPTQKRKEVGVNLYSWGEVSLHDADTNYDRPKPISKEDRIGRIGAIQSIDCGPTHIACVTSGGEVYTAGTNTSGQVQPLERDVSLVTRPRLVESIGNQTLICQVSCGLDHTAALTTTGAVLSWGSNVRGQLGHWKSDRKSSFVPPKTMTLGPSIKATSVACGNQFTIVLTTRLTVLTCGVTLGSSSSDDDTPHELPYLVGLPIGSMAACGNHAVVVTVPGVAYAWGNNNDKSCGRVFPDSLSIPMAMGTPGEGDVETALGTIHHVPKKGRCSAAGSVALSQDVAVAHVSCGTNHTIRVTRSGQLLVSGSNSHGQLGIPTTKIPESSELEIVNHPIAGKKFTKAACGDISTLFLDEDGVVFETTPSGLHLHRLATKVDAISAGGSQYIAACACLPMPLPPLKDMRNVATEIEVLTKKVSQDSSGHDDAISAVGQELVNLMGDMLRYPSAMNNLFFDLSDLNKLYSDLRSVGNAALQQALATTAEKSILAGLDYLQSSNARLKHPGSVRFLLHYIRFFEHDEKRDDGISFDSSGRAIASLCEALLDLSFEGFKHVLAWISLYPPKLFVSMLLKPMMSQLNKALKVDTDADGVVHYKLARKAAPQIGTVLRWLHVAAERNDLASPEDFYCQAISEMPLQDLFVDLLAKKAYENSTHAFLLSESPFLIPPTAKRDLLSIENEISMLKTAAQTTTISSEADDETSTFNFDPFFVIEVERENLLEEAMKAIKEAEPSELRKKLRVKFKDEAGIDAGGVAKEFFQLLSEELFDINSPLWTRRYGDNVTWFNSDCSWDDEGFEYAGVLLGLALYNSVLLDVHFPQAVYRKLLDKSLGLEDLVDEEIKKGLQQLLDYDGDDVEFVFCLTFEVTWRRFGKEQKVELKPGGSNIEVTKDNKEEYVLLYVKWLLVDSIHPQWEAFRKGVDRCLEASSLRDLFTPIEMELLVVGSPELDFEALEKNATYEGGFDANSSVVRNLWRFVKSADRDTQTQFLKFTTGSTKAPIGGLGAMDFKVQRAGADSPQLPTSHTCFNTLLLPDYGNNYEKLSERLGRAVLECEGFGLE